MTLMREKEESFNILNSRSSCSDPILLRFILSQQQAVQKRDNEKLSKDETKWKKEEVQLQLEQ